MAETQPIIIIRKKSGHGRHHGGAWKVAYADFVTAMMALFIVLWMMNASKEIQQAIGGYFKDPTGTSKMVGTNKNGAGVFVAMKRDDLKKLKEELENSVHRVDPVDELKKQIEMTITDEGLKIELMESAKGTFFEIGNPHPTPALQDLLKVLAEQLSQMPNKISIEGHTDSKPYAESKGYDNWDLSTDRANAARKMMQEAGVRSDQILQVRGFADQHLRLPNAPEDPSNRRVSIIVEYQVKDNAQIALPPQLVASVAPNAQAPASSNSTGPNAAPSKPSASTPAPATPPPSKSK